MNRNCILLLLALFSVNIAIGQISISSLPNLSRIIVTEVTNTYHIHTYTVNDSRMLNRLGAALSHSNDFGGVPGSENYDIYYSDAIGNLDIYGAYITIECSYLGTSGGGAMNIAHLELEFSNSFRVSPDRLSHFYGAGNNYIVGSELNAVDCDPITFTTMGNNSATPNTMFLSLTFDFSNIISSVEFVACAGDGFEYISGNTVFNDLNPSGVGYIDLYNGCNMIELVDIDYSLSNRKSYTYNGCKRDDFSIDIGGVTFNEDNPQGQVTVAGSSGCDTLYRVQLNFEDPPTDVYTYNGCKGDDYSINIGGITFNEQNPIGQVFVPGNSGCDTVYSVQLNFKNCKVCKLHYPNIIKTYGSNNEFKIIYADDCDITDPQLRVYDRWGNLVYFDHSNIWNGKFGTASCAPGVYVFVFNYRVEENHYQVHGDVTVLE